MKLHRVLEAQLAYERMGTARSHFVHLLAVVGLVIWLEAIWPDLLRPHVRLVMLALWGSIFFLALWAAVGGYLFHRKLKRCLADKNRVSLSQSDGLL